MTRPAGLEADKVAAWEELYINLKPEIEEIPYLTDDLAELERLAQSGKNIEAVRRELLRAIGTASRERMRVTQAGDALFRRLTLALRSPFGPHSERTLQVRIDPREAAPGQGTGSCRGELGDIRVSSVRQAGVSSGLSSAPGPFDNLRPVS